jgi:hypothetical protein
MSNVKITLTTGIVLMIAAGALTLTQAPPRVVRAGVPERAKVAFTTGDSTICQADEVLPSGVSAIRLGLVAGYGASVHVTAYHGGQLVTDGRRGAGWTTNTVTVPVKPVNRVVEPVTLCFALGPNSEPVYAAGSLTPAWAAAVTVGGGTPPPGSAASNKRLDGRVAVDYLATGRGSWWSRLLSVARHIGIGHFISGTWVAILITMLMAAVGAIAARLTLRELP